MKKTLLMITLVMLTIAASAQSKKVALHHAGTTTLFLGNSAFNQAVTAALPGDTIYIPGGFWDPASIDKRLTIFGAGHSPDSTQATGITHITSGFGIFPGADSTLIQGIEVNGDINFSNGLVSYVTINRCAFNSTTLYNQTSHITFSENLIRSIINANNASDFLNIKNNYIGGYISNIIQGALIENNLFNYQWPGQWYTPYNLNAVNGSLIRNNIFMEPSPSGINNGNSNNLFQNNIFTMSPAYGTNTATGNYENIPAANLFVNYTGINAFYYTDDYHLQTPGAYLGTDATQVGLYGGLNPFKIASVPANPHIRTNNTAQTTDVNGNLNVNISVGAQDH
ncbi:MAG: hypothetical protein IPG85_09000 [Bacteroidetes bacterium]|nr:hypothetical protein [Bacteroidota bacterium]